MVDYSAVIFAYSNFEQNCLILKELVSAHGSGYRHSQDDETNKPLQLFTLLFEGTIVTVILEPQNCKHKVYEVHSIDVPDYFKEALTGAWHEEDEDTIRLTGVDTGVFDVFVAWLYNRTLPGNYLNEITAKERVLQIVQTYRFQVLEFKRAVLKLQVDLYLYQDGG
ncbi:uncharacterized protein M421DRAFT_7277 [Didymella exigua CBS 183.55]|uniref:BTB domain-containing protein n=1 Tax=Didymella exigua CBS 183.55 TaxID=1150837 RepID=A0A6A5RF31_9PLEO|nr:uncharacterized protein M421DRAFT_7277 [Didymella exigua CBS 183.55]KAF1926049.1 hypothetical protein M421DRAFT_7277 [Didymella exigua CBS 183.55]